MADFKIKVVLDPAAAVRAAGTVESALNRVGDASTRLNALIRSTFSALGVTEAVRSIITYSDAYTRLQNRISTVTSSIAEQAAVTQRLFEASDRSRAGFEHTADLYARLAFSAAGLGKSQQEVINLTEALNKTITLSGATTIEAKNALIQLGQGMAAGAVRGDELRSVMEQLPKVAQILADKLGVARGALKELAKKNLITPDVIFSAFREYAAKLEEEFAKAGITIEQGFTRVNNAILRLVGTNAQLSGFNTTVGASLSFLADNLETVARAALTASVAIGIHLAVRAIGALISAIGALTVAILTNPLGALLSLIPLAIGLLVGFGDQILLTSDHVATLKDFAVVAFEELRAAISTAIAAVLPLLATLGRAIETVFSGVVDAVTSIDIGGVVQGIASGINTAVGIVSGAIGGISAIIGIIGPTLTAFFDLLARGTVVLGETLYTTFVQPFVNLASLIGPALSSTSSSVSNFVAEIAGYLANLGFEGILERVSVVGDGVIAILAAMLAGARQILGTFPEIVGELLINGLNSVLAGVEAFANGVLFILGQLPGFSSVGPNSISVPRITEPVTSAIGKLGDAITDGFNDAFGQRIVGNIAKSISKGADTIVGATVKGFQDGVNANLGGKLFGAAGNELQALLDKTRTELAAISSEADQRALERRAVLERQKSELEKALADLNNPTKRTNNGVLGDDKASKAAAKAIANRNAAVSQELSNLDREAEGLRLVGEARDIANAKIALEEKLRTTLRAANKGYTEQQLNDLSRLTAAETVELEAKVRRNLQLKREGDIYNEIRGPLVEYQRNLEALQALLDKGRISTQEFSDKLVDLKIAALQNSRDLASGLELGALQIQKTFGDVASVAASAFTDAFSTMEDALVEFVATGKLDFKSLIDSILVDITRIAIRQAITAPLANALGSVFGSGGGGSGKSDSGSSLFGSIISGLGSIFGFANGGSFEIGGNGGRDNNVLSINGEPAARVSKGETVTVTPNGGGGERPIQVVFNVSTPDANSFSRSQGQLMARASAQLSRAQQRNS